MDNPSIKKIFESFTHLDNSLTLAKRALNNLENPPVEVLSRISAYEDILEKQRTLATTMCGHASLQNWDEVKRHIKLINGLSAMIRDDAKDTASLINGANHKKDKTADNLRIC